MVNFWRPTVVCLRFLAPFPVTPSGLGNQQSDLLTSVDWRTSKELWREKPQPMEDWVELAGGHLPFPGVPEAPFLSGLSPLCVHTYRTPTKMPASKMETSLSSSFLRKLLKGRSCLLNVWLLEINIILGPCLRWINANCSVCSSESDSRSFYNCNKLFFQTACIFPADRHTDT